MATLTCGESIIPIAFARRAVRCNNESSANVVKLLIAPSVTPGSASPPRRFRLWIHGCCSASSAERRCVCDRVSEKWAMT